jgi:hypothetical protein
MASLVLKEFRCVEESNEGGSDSPYFLVFVGDPGSSKLFMLRDGDWDEEVDSGDLIHVFQPFAAVNKNSVVLVALLEEDWDPDYQTGTGAPHVPSSVKNFTKLRTAAQTAWQGLVAAGTYNASALRTAMMFPFTGLVAQRLENDELLGVQSLRVSTLAGDLPLLTFHGDGGEYRVRFSTQ